MRLPRNELSPATPRRLPVVLLALTAVAFVWSGIGPKERSTWFVETVPALVGGIVLAATYRRFPLSSVSYVTTFLFALILVELHGQSMRKKKGLKTAKH
jgi:uncharacterized membrane protein YjdF